MSDINIRLFKDSDYEELSNFQLHDSQTHFTTVPVTIIDSVVKDKDCFPLVVENELGRIVGFFLIHKHYRYEGFKTPYEAAYIRNVNISSKYQGYGYGKRLVMEIPKYAKKYLSSISNLFLVVDFKNRVALNLYEKSGFVHIATKPHGPVGPELLYYLDLNETYLNNISLSKINDQEITQSFSILDNDGISIGHLTGQVENNKYIINSILIHTNEKHDILDTVLRYLGPELRKSNPSINLILHNKKLDIKQTSIYLKNGFIYTDIYKNSYVKYL